MLVRFSESAAELHLDQDLDLSAGNFRRSYSCIIYFKESGHALFNIVMPSGLLEAGQEVSKHAREAVVFDLLHHVG